MDRHGAVRRDRHRDLGVFASADKVWGIADGTDRAGPFHHFHVTPPASMVHTSPVKTAGQFKAETRQAFITLRRGLDFYNQNTFDTAVSLLMGGQNGFAKFLPQAQALAELKANPVAGRLWATIGTHGAQVGSIRSAAIGSLLDDIAAGKDADACRNRFLAVINPLSYQRPQAAPSAGNVAQAERIVDALGLRESFPRRYVGLADPVACSKASWWTPAEPTQKVAPVKPAKGMFASMLTPDELAKAQGKAAKMTWVRFRDTVLANARAIELVMPKAASFGALTTAVNPDAPPLFTWDKPDARNPYSWYRWMGATAQDFGFTEGAPVTVRCMMPVPSTWDGSKLHDGLILVLDGARDAQAAVAGTGLFPELLRPELFEVRRTVHAFSAKDILVDQGGPLFAGVVLRDSAPINLTLRVHTRTAAMDYTIDRWQ